MKIQKVQNNNYNQTFGARVTIIDEEKIVPHALKSTFKNLCKDLGEKTDEIILEVFKGKNNAGELEKDIFSGEVKQGFLTHSYYDSFKNRFDIVGDRFTQKNIFEEELPVWTSREYSMPRNLTKIYRDYILPLFNKNGNYLELARQCDNAERKLLTSVKLENK